MCMAYIYIYIRYGDCMLYVKEGSSNTLAKIRNGWPMWGSKSRRFAAGGPISLGGGGPISLLYRTLNFSDVRQCFKFKNYNSHIQCICTITKLHTVTGGGHKTSSYSSSLVTSLYPNMAESELLRKPLLP